MERLRQPHPAGAGRTRDDARDEIDSVETTNDSRQIEYLVIDEGRVVLRTGDVGEARACYLGHDGTVDVWVARRKWGAQPNLYPSGGLSDGF